MRSDRQRGLLKDFAGDARRTYLARQNETDALRIH
jgi:hypothetical protein